MLRLRSGNSQSCRSLVHVPHLGLTRSHFNFRFRHDTQEIVLSDGGGALEEVVGTTISGESMSMDDALESERPAWSGWPGLVTSAILRDDVFVST